MAKLYKDFGKEAKDLLTKQYEAAGSWKVETKGKNTVDRTIFINPKAANGGDKVWADVEWNSKADNIKTKAVVAANKFAPEVTYEKGDNTVKVASTSLDKDAKVTVEAETKVNVAEKSVALWSNYTTANKQSLMMASYQLNKSFMAGVSGTLAFANGFALKSWSAGFRMNKAFDGNNMVFAAALDDADKITASLFGPVNLKIADKTHKMTIAAQAAVKISDTSKPTWAVGTEMPVQGHVLKLKMDQDLKLSLSQVFKLSNNVEAAVTWMIGKNQWNDKILDPLGNFGVNFTRT